MSNEDIAEFNKDFKTDISIKNVSYNNVNEINYIEYSFNHQKIDEYIYEMENWLKNNEVPYNYIMISSNITVTSSKDFSLKKIHAFEKEFDVEYDSLEISCNSRDKSYIFH